MSDGGRDTIIFIDRNNISIYAGDQIMRLEIPSQVLMDLDIIDKGGFDSAVDTFIKSKKISASHVWIILSEAICFSRDFEEKDQGKLENDIKNFTDAVPFDLVISKRYKSQTGVRVIASNLGFIETVREIFEREGFSVEGVVPGIIFPVVGSKRQLDAEFAKAVLTNIPLAVQANMMPKPITEKVGSEPLENNGKNHKKGTLPYLIGVFVVLIVILLVVVFTRS